MLTMRLSPLVLEPGRDARIAVVATTTEIYQPTTRRVNGGREESAFCGMYAFCVNKNAFVFLACPAQGMLSASLGKHPDSTRMQMLKSLQSFALHESPMNPRPTDFDPTMTGSWRQPSPGNPSNSDFVRLEGRLYTRLDRSDERIDEHFRELADAFKQLLVLNERQTHAVVLHEQLRERVTIVEAKAAATASRLAEWINYGCAAWFVASGIFLVWSKWPT